MMGSPARSDEREQGRWQFSDDLGFESRLSQLSDEHLRIAAVGEVVAAAFFG